MFLLRREIVPLLAILGGIAYGFIFGFAVATPSAQAAPPTVPLCQAVAKADAILIYACQPDNGPPFLINSVGFMALEE